MTDCACLDIKVFKIFKRLNTHNSSYNGIFKVYIKS